MSDARIHGLLTTSLLVSSATAIVATSVATFLAVVFLRTDLPGRSAGPWLLGGLLFLPLYIHIAGWETILGRFGWWTSVDGSLASPLLTGSFATIWIHAVAALPWGVLFVAAGLAIVDPAWEETALCDVAWPTVLRRITLPAVAPFVLLAGLWIASTTAGEMTVTNIYQVRTYAEEIYTNFSLGATAAETLRSAIPGMFVLAALAGGLFLCVRQIVPATTLGRMHTPRDWPLGKARWPVAIATWLVIGSVVLVPLVSLVHQCGVVVVETDGNFVRGWATSKAATTILQAPGENLPEAQSTFALALAAAAVTLPLVLLPAWWGGTSHSRIVPWLLLLPAFIPGPLVGIAVIQLLNRPEDPTGFLIWLYDDTLAAPVLAVLPRTIPLAGLILWSAFRQTPRDLKDIAALYRPRTLQAWLLIRGLHWRACLAAFIAAAAVAAGDLSCSILVLPPGVRTVAFHVFQLLHAGCDDRLSALCLVQFALTAMLGGVICRLLRGST